MSSFPLQQGASGVPEQLEQPVPGAILLRQDLQGKERGEEHDEFIPATFLTLLLTMPFVASLLGYPHLTVQTSQW